MDAAGQMFFTLSLGFGALISFASYMPIKNNCVRDAYTVVFINCGTSLFAGIVVFSILGHREFVTGMDVTKVLIFFFGHSTKRFHRYRCCQLLLHILYFVCRSVVALVLRLSHFAMHFFKCQFHRCGRSCSSAC